ncbi:MAG: hypothetical protein IJ763_05235 [Lachnospiraceae bacterium]|nr:hypothetical protein [Lachnospiraceae bacterium]
MGEKITIIIAMAAVMIMMPYLITIAINGRQNEDNSNIKNINTGKDILININGENKLMDVEEYIVGVLPGVASPDNNNEILAAQAVAVRTEIYFAMGSDTVLREDNLTYEYYSKEKYIEKWGKTSYNENYARYEYAVMSTVGKIIE